MTATTETRPAPNRVGQRFGQVSELTVIVPLVEGGAEVLRRKLAAAPEARIAATDRVGTVHSMRFVIFDDDRRLLFATAFDGDWDTYIEDFARIIPEELNFLFAETVGWPGIDDPGVKDFIAAHQITADSWYCAYPGLRVTDINRNARVAAAIDGLLDAVNP
jgi:hypothetical protein